jgi:hypothetical protein
VAVEVHYITVQQVRERAAKLREKAKLTDEEETTLAMDEALLKLAAEHEAKEAG